MIAEAKPLVFFCACQESTGQVLEGVFGERFHDQGTKIVSYFWLFAAQRKLHVASACVGPSC